MIVKNKKTGIEYVVTVEQWQKMKANEFIKDKFVVADSSDVTEIVSAKGTAILPEEIINFKKNRIKTLKK